MKKIFKKLTFLAVPLMVLGCAGPVNTSNSSASRPSSTNSGENTSSKSSSTSSVNSGSGVHAHEWASEWSSDQNNHWHACASCNEKKDNAAHSFGEWKTES